MSRYEVVCSGRVRGEMSIVIARRSRSWANVVSSGLEGYLLW